MAKYYDIGKYENRVFVLNKFGSRCAYCGCDLTLKTLQVDHIIPARRKMINCLRGEHTIENYNPSCQVCNMSKSSLDLEKWRNELSKKVDRLKRDSSTFRIAIKYGLIKTVNTNVVFYFERIKNG